MDERLREFFVADRAAVLGITPSQRRRQCGVAFLILALGVAPRRVSHDDVRAPTAKSPGDFRRQLAGNGRESIFVEQQVVELRSRVSLPAEVDRKSTRLNSSHRT